MIDIHVYTQLYVTYKLFLFKLGKKVIITKGFRCRILDYVLQSFETLLR